MDKLTESQIRRILDRYVAQKEYRRLYYADKYNNDEKYRQYVRDYNKRRYELKKYNDNIKKGLTEGQSKNIMAKSCLKYLKKHNREDEFKKAFPEEYLLLNPETSTDNTTD
jgi:hypothetical protein